MFDYDNYVGKIGIVRVFNGLVKKNESVLLMKSDGSKENGCIIKFIGFLGLVRIEIENVYVGDIVAFVGFNVMDVGDSVVDFVNFMFLDFMYLEEFMMSVYFVVNDLFLVGLEGKYVIVNKLKDRFLKEM